MAGLTDIFGARRLVRLLASSLLLVLLTNSAIAQGPQFDVGAPPGASAGGSVVGHSLGANGGAVVIGQPLGAANFPDVIQSSAPFSGRAGPQGSRVPASALSTPGVPVRRTAQAQVAIRQTAQPLETPQYGELELESDVEDFGSPDGMNLDTAIDLLVHQNLDLHAARLEIPMADADVLTANLRANPIFYADTQLIPYGHYSFLRPGGPAQTDVNVNYPLDLTFKRQARTRSAREAKSVTEAQLQDAIRNQIDNLYTVYEDDVSAGLTLRFSEVYLKGIRQLETLIESLYKSGQLKESDLLAVRANVQLAELQVKESKQGKIKANRALALILNLPLDAIEQIEQLDVRDRVGKLRPPPMNRDELVQRALTVRPDLIAWKYGLRRANADVKLARAEAYPDAYVLWQPYTFQNNTYLGVQSAYSWTLGITATIPIYGRNQGNITRAKVNVSQTELQVLSAERVVVSDVLGAVQELEQSLVAVVEFRKEIIPTWKKVRDAALTRFKGGDSSLLEFLAAQQDYNDKVRAYRDALVRHRRAILDLNTAVGERVLP
jgi:cobalt-zinc-cadmium efflux system outer membrane protein